MKKLTFWYYFWIIFLAIQLLLYFLLDNMDIRLAVVVGPLGLFLTFMRERISKKAYYVVAGCCTIVVLGLFVYIVAIR